MKKITLKKRSASIMAGVLALTLIGGTLAYYQSSDTLENKLSTKAPGGEQLVEQFTPKDDWTPGQKVTKKAELENKSEIPLLVRVKMHEEWTLANGTKITTQSTAASFRTGNGQVSATDGLTTGDGSVVIKEMTNSSWVYNADGYWYYNAVLAAGAGTSFLESITLNSTTDMGAKGEIQYYTKKAAPRPADTAIGGDDATQWVVIPSTGAPAGTTFMRSVSSVDSTKPGYAGAKYSLFITYETYQATPAARAEAVAGGWNSGATPSVS